MLLDKKKLQKLDVFFSTRPVLRAYLFGSQVRGTADADSDVDILVDLDYSQRIGLQFVQMKLDLEQLLESKVDLVSSKGVSKHVLPFLEKDKQLIYARQAGG